MLSGMTRAVNVRAFTSTAASNSDSLCEGKSGEVDIPGTGFAQGKIGAVAVIESFFRPGA